MVGVVVALLEMCLISSFGGGGGFGSRRSRLPAVKETGRRAKKVPKVEFVEGERKKT